ncbi:MAG: hypothetical protein ACI3XJ_09010, partial [Oscillospiraceae bacterium]
DPSVHDYSEDKPEFVCIGHDHYVYGNKKEIAEYKAIREKGVPLKTITIADGSEPEAAPEQPVVIPEGEYIKAPVRDTGSRWYTFLSFLLPIPGLIVALILKRFRYIRNYKACKKGALAGFITLGVIVLLFLLLLLLAVV